METPSGVHGGFKVTKPSKFSGNFKTMVNDNGNQFSSITNNIPDGKKKLFALSYFDRTFFNWVQPRLEFFLEYENKKQKQKTQQMFYKFDNFCIYIKRFSEIKMRITQLKSSF